MRTLWPPSGQLVSLGEGLSMVPVSESLLAELESMGHPAFSADSRFEFLTPGVAAIAETVSANGPVAYVETEYFGGEGFERAVVWHEGGVATGPLDGPGAINQALRSLGVVPPDGSRSEPFDLVGLGRYRSLNEWLRDA